MDVLGVGDAVTAVAVDTNAQWARSSACAAGRGAGARWGRGGGALRCSLLRACVCARASPWGRPQAGVRLSSSLAPHCIGQRRRLCWPALTDLRLLMSRRKVLHHSSCCLRRLPSVRPTVGAQGQERIGEGGAILPFLVWMGRKERVPYARPAGTPRRRRRWRGAPGQRGVLVPGTDDAGRTSRRYAGSTFPVEVDAPRRLQGGLDHQLEGTIMVIEQFFLADCRRDPRLQNAGLRLGLWAWERTLLARPFSGGRPERPECLVTAHAKATGNPRFCVGNLSKRRLDTGQEQASSLHPETFFLRYADRDIDGRGYDRAQAPELCHSLPFRNSPTALR